MLFHILPHLAQHAYFTKIKPTTQKPNNLENGVYTFFFFCSKLNIFLFTLYSFILIVPFRLV
jgi:hypothetical protein